jgi:hypothetical protein
MGKRGIVAASGALIKEERRGDGMGYTVAVAVAKILQVRTNQKVKLHLLSLLKKIDICN